MTMIIGHRGSHASGSPVENTLEAFEAAIQAGADMVELDVWQLADGELCIYHDGALPGDGRPLASLTLVDLEGARLEHGARIPRLSAALELMRGRIPVNVELKHGLALASTLALIRDLRMAEDVVLSSFVIEAMVEARERAPEIARAVIMGTSTLHPAVRFREWAPFWSLRRADARLWHAAAALVGPGIVEALHGLGVGVNVWTVNDALMARRLVAAGVDGLFTDRPAELRRALA